jgi:hypothetical protein
MNFKLYRNSGVNISLFQRSDNSGDGVSFVATHPNEDVWGNGDTQSFDNASIFCFKKELSRFEWAKQKGYENHTQAVSDFKNAIEMFSNNNFEHPVTQYFLNLMLDAIKLNENKNKFDANEKINKESAIESVHQNAWNLRDLPIEFRNNKEVVLEAVKQSWCGQTLQFTSKELQNNREVVLTAVCSSGDALQYASEELKNDKEIVLTALKNSMGAFKYESKMHEGAYPYVSYALRNDREVVLEAVQHGSTLALAASNFQDDIEIVRAAVSQDGEALEYASPRLRGNREIVLEAVKQNGNAIMHASPCFDDDKEVIITALSNLHDDGIFISDEKVRACMSRRLREDPSVDPCAVTDYITYNDSGPLMQKFQNLLAWREIRQMKEERERDWQMNYGVINKNRLDKWQNDLVQWQQSQKNNQYEVYKALRTEIEHMPKHEIWKQQVFAKHRKLCGICGTNNNLEIHHKRSFHSIIKQNCVKDKYQAFECELLWDVDNGSVICSECHARMESSRTHKKLSNGDI